MHFILLLLCTFFLSVNSTYIWSNKKKKAAEQVDLTNEDETCVSEDAEFCNDNAISKVNDNIFVK